MTLIILFPDLSLLAKKSNLASFSFAIICRMDKHWENLNKYKVVLEQNEKMIVYLKF